MRTLRVLIVPPTGDVENKVVEAKLETFQAIVGGYIEAVSPNTVDAPPWLAYCNEEGKLQRLPMNRRATRLAYAAGWWTDDVLMGTVVFLGQAEDKDGEVVEADVPDDLVARLDVNE